VCKLTRRSPNAVARHRLKPQVDGTTPRPPNACLPAEPLASKGYRRPCTPPRLKGWRAHPKRWVIQNHIAEEGRPRRWRCPRLYPNAASINQGNINEGIRGQIYTWVQCWNLIIKLSLSSCVYSCVCTGFAAARAGRRRRREEEEGEGGGLLTRRHRGTATPCRVAPVAGLPSGMTPYRVMSIPPESRILCPREEVPVEPAASNGRGGPGTGAGRGEHGQHVATDCSPPGHQIHSRSAERREAHTACACSFLLRRPLLIAHVRKGRWQGGARHSSRRRRPLKWP
jgi:hypothetical protein